MFFQKIDADRDSPQKCRAWSGKRLGHQLEVSSRCRSACVRVTQGPQGPRSQGLGPWPLSKGQGLGPWPRSKVHIVKVQGPQGPRSRPWTRGQGPRSWPFPRAKVQGPQSPRSQGLSPRKPHGVGPQKTARSWSHQIFRQSVGLSVCRLMMQVLGLHVWEFRAMLCVCRCFERVRERESERERVSE